MMQQIQLCCAGAGENAQHQDPQRDKNCAATAGAAVTHTHSSSRASSSSSPVLVSTSSNCTTGLYSAWHSSSAAPPSSSPSPSAAAAPLSAAAAPKPAPVNPAKPPPAALAAPKTGVGCVQANTKTASRNRQAAAWPAKHMQAACRVTDQYDYNVKLHLDLLRGLLRRVCHLDRPGRVFVWRLLKRVMQDAFSRL